MKVCDACGVERPPSDTPDPCLGELPSVTSACCGHGHRALCYVVLKDRNHTMLRGTKAWDKMQDLGGNPALISGPELDLDNLPDELPQRWIEKE